MDYKVSRLIVFYENGYNNTAIMLKGHIDGIIKRGHTDNEKLVEIIKYTIKEFQGTKRLIKKVYNDRIFLQSEYLAFTDKLIILLKKELKNYVKQD